MKICQLHEAEEKCLKIKNEVGELKKSNVKTNTETVPFYFFCY